MTGGEYGYDWCELPFSTGSTDKGAPYSTLVGASSDWKNI